jgi:hypothetical protein
VYGWEKGHYVFEAKGPGRRATLEETTAALTAIAERLEGALAEGKAGPLVSLLLPVAARMKAGAGPGLTEAPRRGVEG